MLTIKFHQWKSVSIMVILQGYHQVKFDSVAIGATVPMYTGS